MIQKQTVYLPVKVENNKEDFTSATFYITEPSDDGEKITHFLKPQEGYFFTPEQLNEYTANVVRHALETAAENAEIKERKVSYSSSSGSEYGYVQSINKKSITNTFEESYKKFEV